MVHSEKRLYLVFEYLDLDLKKHMDTCPDLAKDPRVIKVCRARSASVSMRFRLPSSNDINLTTEDTSSHSYLDMLILAFFLVHLCFSILMTQTLCLCADLSISDLAWDCLLSCPQGPSPRPETPEPFD